MSQTIAMVATGSIGPEDKILKAKSILEERYHCSVLLTDECYTPLPAEKRAERFLAHCLNDDVTHLWSIRGGEGSADLIPYLHKHLPDLALTNNKTLIGFSDFTPILLYFAQELQWQCIHGMGALQFVNGTPDSKTLGLTDQVIRGTMPNLVTHLQPLNQAAEKAEIVKGPITGGNLTLCHLTIREQYELKTNGKIIFVEDWQDKGYRVDRTLKYLDRIHFLNKPKALIFGDFFAGAFSPDPEQQTMQTDYMWTILRRFAEKQTYPVYFTPRIGHGKANDPIALEHQVELIKENYLVTSEE